MKEDPHPSLSKLAMDHRAQSHDETEDPISRIFTPKVALWISWTIFLVSVLCLSFIDLTVFRWVRELIAFGTKSAKNAVESYDISPETEDTILSTGQALQDFRKGIKDDFLGRSDFPDDRKGFPPSSNSGKSSE